MKRKSRNNPPNDRLSEVERIKYFQEMESKLSNLSSTDQYLLEFAKDFLNTLNLSNAEDGDTVQMGPLDIKLLEYLIISIIVSYQEAIRNP